MPYKFLVNTVGCLTCRCQNVYSGYEKSAIQEAWHNTFLVSWLECLQLSHDIRENGDKKELKLWRHHLSINSYYSKLSAKKRKLNQKLTNNTRNSKSQPILSLNGAPLFLQQPWLATQHLASRIVRYCDLPFGSSVQKCQGWCHLRCGPEDTAFCYQYLPQTSIYADCWGTQSPVVYVRSQRRLSPTISDRMASLSRLQLASKHSSGFVLFGQSPIRAINWVVNVLLGTWRTTDNHGAWNGYREGGNDRGLVQVFGMYVKRGRRKMGRKLGERLIEENRLSSKLTTQSSIYSHEWSHRQLLYSLSC